MAQRRKAKRIPKTITGDALIEAAFRKTLSALRGLTHSERTRVLRAVVAFYQDEGREDG